MTQTEWVALVEEARRVAWRAGHRAHIHAHRIEGRWVYCLALAWPRKPLQG